MWTQRTQGRREGNGAVTRKVEMGVVSVRVSVPLLSSPDS